jgi:hypothetical protein
MLTKKIHALILRYENAGNAFEIMFLKGGLTLNFAVDFSFMYVTVIVFDHSFLVANDR